MRSALSGGLLRYHSQPAEVALSGQYDSVMIHKNSPAMTVHFLHNNSQRSGAKPLVCTSRQAARRDGQGKTWNPNCGNGTESSRVKERLRAERNRLALELRHADGPDGRTEDGAVPTLAPREPSATEREIHELTLLRPQQWCRRCGNVGSGGPSQAGDV